MSSEPELFIGESGRGLSRAPRVGVIGARGLVGEAVVASLFEREFPFRELRLFGSERGGRSLLEAGSEKLEVLPLVADEVPTDLDLAFFAATGELSRELAPRLARAGTIIIDKSATWRSRAAVPLVVPEVNGATLANHAGLIASPNCTTIGLVLALAPLARAAGLRRVVVTTLQAASGAGRAGLDALSRERAQASNAADAASPFADRLDDNVLPQCDVLFDHGASGEEVKLLRESRRILDREDLEVLATCVRVPVGVGHSASVCVELERSLTVDEARAIFEAAPPVRCLGAQELPVPRAVRGTDDVLVGRLRSGADGSAEGLRENELSFFQTSDNLRRGAATNALRIAEELLGR